MNESYRSAFILNELQVSALGSHSGLVSFFGLVVRLGVRFFKSYLLLDLELFLAYISLKLRYYFNYRLIYKHFLIIMSIDREF